MQADLTEMLQNVAETLGAQAGTLWFYHRFEDGLIRPITVYGENELKNIYILPGEGVAGQVIDKGESVIIVDCRADSRWTKKVDVETGFVTKSTICVPLKLDEMVYGSIQLVNKTDDQSFDENDLRHLEELAESISGDMANHPLLDEYRTSSPHKTLEKENDAQRIMIKRLSTYMDPSIIYEILREDGKHKKSIEPREAVVLFADIRGFTSLTQKISSTQLISALSDFLAITSRCIHKYGGIIDKFMGDCTMAYWRVEDNAQAGLQAAKCALAIQQEAQSFTAQILRQTGIEIGIGIGVHIGPVLLCHVGDEQYMAYTVLGSTVNTACRIEEHAPAGTVYISDNLADCLGEHGITAPIEQEIFWRGKDDKLVVVELKEVK